MNPIVKYLKNLFPRERLLGKDTYLRGFQKADALLTELIDTKKVPGLSITVLGEGGTLFQKGYGYADIERVNHVEPKRTVFRVASVSKPITATALAIMVQEGIMDLDASFYDYVPYYPKKRWDFTIRQLATHTAGLRSYRGKEFALNQPYSIRDGLGIFKDDPLVFEPGKGYLYNSFDFVLLSLAMQEAAKTPFEDYVKRKVLDSLGMSNTFPERGPDKEKANTIAHSLSMKEKNGNKAVELSQNYTKTITGFRKAVPVNNFYKLAGGGYLSTSEDIARLGQAYVHGGLLDRTILPQFLTSQTVNGNATYYGMGWQVTRDKSGRPFYGHVGSSVGAYSNFFIYPREQMVFSILINCTDPKVQGPLDKVVDCLLDSESFSRTYTSEPHPPLGK
ncbi:MAG: serine hydrolase domain-containing protein [Bacteroidota bacterium]